MAKKTGSNIPPIAGGTYPAVCYTVADLGTHQSFEKALHKVVIVWEIPELRIEVERNGEKVNLPRAISKIYTLSLHEKSNLYKDLVAWRGVPFTADELEGFDVLSVVGANCLLQIIQEKKGDSVYANVAAVMHALKDTQKLTAENPEIRYAMALDGFDIPESLPDWVKKMIKQSAEYQATSGTATNPDLDRAQEECGCDIPF